MRLDRSAQRSRSSRTRRALPKPAQIAILGGATCALRKLDDSKRDCSYAPATFNSTRVERKEQCSQMMQGMPMALQGTTASSSSSVAPRCAR